MELAVLLLVLVGCLAIGVPVAFSLLTASIACFFVLDIPLVYLARKIPLADAPGTAAKEEASA